MLVHSIYHRLSIFLFPYLIFKLFIKWKVTESLDQSVISEIAETQHNIDKITKALTNTYTYPIKSVRNAHRSLQHR